MMKTPFDGPMAEAARLTRAGDLSEATRLIRSMLSGGASETPRGDGPIDLTPTRVTAPSKGEAEAKRGPARGAEQGRLVERRYGGSGRALDYLLYVPRDARDGMPLVVMLHGCTQSPEDFARGTGMNRLADEFGVLVAYPRQTEAANPQKCWNWFRPGDQQRDRGEPALIAGVVRQVLADQHAEPRRVYVAGLSAGGAEAAVMAACYPDLFAAVGVHSGIAFGAARDLPGALAAMKRGVAAKPGQSATAFVPVITFHGDRDPIVHADNSREIIAAAVKAIGEPLTTRSETGRGAAGRSYTREISTNAQGRVLIEQWTVHGAGHAWFGGASGGSYTDPTGPDASREMLHFFLAHEAGRAAGR